MSVLLLHPCLDFIFGCTVTSHPNSIYDGLNPTGRLGGGVGVGNTLQGTFQRQILVFIEHGNRATAHHTTICIAIDDRKFWKFNPLFELAAISSVGIVQSPLLVLLCKAAG